ncbi:MAG: SHOCT domain-containing protein [Rhodocyclaceae bacterium]|nr:SHOCT domain-containing protein [Rhodocyclaceae bacterium]
MYGFENGVMGMGGGWFGMILMWIIPLLLIFVIVRFFIGRADGVAPRSPREILDARYAAGEIEREEYLMRLADLKA